MYKTNMNLRRTVKGQELIVGRLGSELLGIADCGFESGHDGGLFGLY